MTGALAGRVAVVHGGGGALGGAVARAFAREGAAVFLAGRTRARLAAVADAIAAAGGRAEADVVDALDTAAVEAHADAVVERAGAIDVAFNAVGVAHVQGVPLPELSLEDYLHPIDVYTRTNFITAKAAARHMVARRSGVLLLVTTPAGRMPGPGFMGHSVACAGVEGMTRHLAGELGAFGIRVACLRSHAIPDAITASHSRETFDRVAARTGLTIDQMMAGAAQQTLLKRLPTLDQLARTAVFLASDGAGAITGAVANLTGGFVLD